MTGAPAQIAFSFSSPARSSVVLIGPESSGKSAIFRALTGHVTGDEANFRGSTVSCRRGPGLAQLGSGVEVVDTPGVRFEDDSLTTRTALAAAVDADVLLLVARGTHARRELAALVDGLGRQIQERRIAIALTFRDRASSDLARFAETFATRVGVPVVTLDARRCAGVKTADGGEELALAAALRDARVPLLPLGSALPELMEVQPRATAFEWARLGPVVAATAVLLLYGAPVYLAYVLAEAVQPRADALVIEPIKAAIAGALSSGSALQLLASDLLIGSYGVLTLGWYSFLWAFPVVLLMGMTVAVSDETGVKDRITSALDPWLRRMGLDGRDLTPVLTGYGCNVVAAVQTRSSSSCTRKSCLSLIAFGSACSYQMGASLSLFGGTGRPWLFAPYLLLLFVVGAIHTRIWNSQAARPRVRLQLAERAFLQPPSWRAVRWKVVGVIRQFLLTAIPAFIGICLVAALLSHFGVMDRAARVVAPALSVFRLPGEAAPGIIFSVLRKDGLLVLNQDGGTLLAKLTAGQLLVLVYLASTLTACLVTLWTIRREVGGRFALTLVGRQIATSLVSSLLLAWTLGGWQ